MNDGNGGERVGRGEEESGADLGGEREAQGPRGERGEWERGPRRRGGAGALILPVAGEGVRRGRPLFRPRSGEQGRGEGESGLGRGRGAGGGPAWAGGGLGRGSSGGGGLLFFSFDCFVFCFLFFVYFLFCFISFKSI